MASPESPRTAYDDFATPAQMRADCVETGHHLQVRLGRIAERAVEPAPSLLFEDYPQEVRKRNIEVSDAAVRLAGALHLHLD